MPTKFSLSANFWTCRLLLTNWITEIQLLNILSVIEISRYHPSKQSIVSIIFLHHYYTISSILLLQQNMTGILLLIFYCYSFTVFPTAFASYTYQFRYWKGKIIKITHCNSLHSSEKERIVKFLSLGFRILVQEPDNIGATCPLRSVWCATLRP